MNNTELKARFNEYYYIAIEIADDHRGTDLEFVDILKITEILVRIDKNE